MSSIEPGFPVPAISEMDQHPLASGVEVNDCDQSEVLALGWAAVDGLADQAAIERLEHLISSEQGAKEAYESVLALDYGLQAYFGLLSPPTS